MVDSDIIGGRNTRVTLGDLKEALAKTQGNMTNAAKILGVSRMWIFNKSREIPEVREAIDESKKQVLDKCVSTALILALGIPIMENGKFVGWQEKPDSLMLRYFMSTLGRDEGFGDNIDVTSAGEKLSGGIQVEIIDKREQVEKNEQ